MPPNLRKVTKTEFFKAIGPQNAHPTPEGKFPYTSVFRTPYRAVAGVIENVIPEGEAFPKTTYHLPA